MSPLMQDGKLRRNFVIFFSCLLILFVYQLASVVRYPNRFGFNIGTRYEYVE